MCAHRFELRRRHVFVHCHLLHRADYGRRRSIVSVESDRSSACSVVAEPVLRARAAALVHECGNLRHPAVRATPTACDRAEQFTEAVECYVRGDFADAIACLDQLAALDRSTSGSLTLAASIEMHQAFVLGDTPAERLREMCERYLREPPGADFDGTWAAAQK